MIALHKPYRWIALLLAGFFLSGNAIQQQQESIYFEITDGRNAIGELVATRTVNGDFMTLHVESQTHVRRIISITVDLEVDLQYHRGNLMRSRSQTKVNGLVQDRTTLEWRNGKYKMDVDGVEKEWGNAIRYSGSLMYFVEPEFVGTVFSEKAGVYDPIIRVGEGQYVVEKSDGIRQTFTYVNGSLMRIEYPHSVMNVVIKRKR